MVLVFTPDRKHLEIYQYQYQRLWTTEHVNMVIFFQVDFQKWKDEDDSDNEEQVQYSLVFWIRIRNSVYGSKQ
jgi:hypothetical protein